MPRNCLIDTRLHICKFFGKKMKNFFSSPNFALRDLVIAWLSGGTNNLHFATHFSAQKVANVKNLQYLCTRVRQTALTDVAERHKARSCYLGRDDAPRCPSRSKAKVNCFLHALPTANSLGLVCVGDPIICETLRWLVSGTPGKTPQAAFGLACVGDPGYSKTVIH